MKTITVAAVSLNQTARDWSGNTSRVIQALNELKKQKVGVACFPELCLSGYGCEDGFSHPSTARLAKKALFEVIPHTKGLVANFGLPLPMHRALYNCTAVVADGELLGIVPKKALAGEGIHYEPRWFKAWPEGMTDLYEIFDTAVPIGDLLFDIGGVRIGYEICEEAWTAERPGRKHAAYGIDIECNPSASHFAFGKKKMRDLFVLDGSRAFCCTYLYSNLLGCESGRQIYDGGNLIALDGEMIARGERFLFEDFSITTAPIDLEYSRALFSKKHWSEPAYDKAITVVKKDLKLPESVDAPKYSAATEAEWERSAEPLFEEFSRATALGLHDYMRKSRSQGFVVSLSGGCDSATVSILAMFSVLLPYRALGRERFWERLSYMGQSEEFSKAHAKESDIVKQFLITVWQETENNSAATKESAKAVASAINSRHYEIAIDALVESYKQLAEQCLGFDLNFKNHGLVLQNLQARVRGPLPWTLANVEGKLLLTTSNRSESALGYCTMDGDTAGGLNPIGGVDKAFLRRWLVWIEKQGAVGFPPFEDFSAVNSLAPSAELLPKESQQRDEDDLGPYTVVTFIEDRFMRRGQAPVEILPELLRVFGPESGGEERYSREELLGWLKRFFVLFARNQWKRERLAPCFHLDHVNLDPRTWCRWPILSGGFESELAELEMSFKKASSK